MFVYAYECDTCRLHVVARCGVIGYYQTPSANRLHVRTTPTWCDNCRTVVISEDLPDQFSLALELEKLKTSGPDSNDEALAEVLGVSVDEFCERRIGLWVQWLEAFRDRIAPSRCIECGATAGKLLRTENGSMPNEFPHPHCSGTFTLTRAEHGIPATYFVLDIEGNRIGADEGRG